MASSLSVTPFIAETTTTTLEFCATGFTSSAACNIREAPSREVPPNLNATISLRQPSKAEVSRLRNSPRVSVLRDERVSLCANTAGTKRGDKSPSADDSVCTFLAFMMPLRLVPLERLGGGIQRKNP